jgi:hypothetical protein
MTLEKFVEEIVPGAPIYGYNPQAKHGNRIDRIRVVASHGWLTRAALLHLADAYASAFKVRKSKVNYFLDVDSNELVMILWHN